MRRKLITREGYQKLKDEVDYLWRKERPEITKIVTWAAALGDRSENADYQYNKKKLRVTISIAFTIPSSTLLFPNSTSDGNAALITR